MSTDTSVPRATAPVNNNQDVAAWMSSYWPDSKSLAINPQSGNELWIVRPNGAVELRRCTVPPAPSATAFPANVSFRANPTMPTLKQLFAKFRFAGQATSALQTELLLCVWTVILFLRGLASSKPLLLITGNVGSGKTVLGRLIGRALLGRKFNVMRLPPHERDYAALMASSPYVVLDNVESMPRWMPDDLATQVTGGAIPLRQLYTDTNLIDALLNAYVAITAASPDWLSSYLLDRSIVIRVEKPVVRIPEQQLDAFVDTYRGQILSECLTVARLALMQIAAKEPTVEIDFRLSDFASYGSVIAEVISGADGKRNFPDALKAMSSERLALAEDADAVLAALIAIAKDNPGPVTSGALIDMLAHHMSDRAAAWSAVGNPTQLGKTLAALRTRVTGIVDITKTTIHGRAKYKITLVGGVGWRGSSSSSSSEKKERLVATPPHPRLNTPHADRICGACGVLIMPGERAFIDFEGGLIECAACGGGAEVAP